MITIIIRERITVEVRERRNKVRSSETRDERKKPWVGGWDLPNVGKRLRSRLVRRAVRDDIQIENDFPFFFKVFKSFYKNLSQIITCPPPCLHSFHWKWHQLIKRLKLIRIEKVRRRSIMEEIFNIARTTYQGDMRSERKYPKVNVQSSSIAKQMVAKETMTNFIGEGKMKETIYFRLGIVDAIPPYSP